MVDEPLTDVDVRVLGALIEKDMATPDYYPLSLNALMNACNQSLNRDPVMQLDEDAILRSIDGLRKRSLVRATQGISSRVMKYRHLVGEAMSLDPRETALLGVLMLRGPQTTGELRARSSRLTSFDSPAEVESVLSALIAREGPALVMRLPRQPGQKEVRYAHLLSGPVTFETPDVPAMREPPDAERMRALEETTEELRKEVADLRRQLEEFRKQFE
jgi:uncharacterized protein YceH (UPF0502 family)